MFNQKRGPRWGILYMIVPLAAGLFWLEMKAPFSETGHRAVDVGIVLLIFGLVELWLRTNRLAFLREDYRKQEKIGLQSRLWVALSEQVPVEEPGASRVEATLPPVGSVGANGHGRVSRTLVTAWSASDSGPLPIRHSRFDPQWGPCTVVEEK
jgi:hypothetical protein